MGSTAFLSMYRIWPGKVSRRTHHEEYAERKVNASDNEKCGTVGSQERKGRAAQSVIRVAALWSQWYPGREIPSVSYEKYGKENNDL